MARGSRHKAKPGGVSSEHQEMFWCCARAAQRDGSVSVLGHLQKPAGHGHGQPALGAQPQPVWDPAIWGNILETPNAAKMQKIPSENAWMLPSEKCSRITNMLT